MKPFKLILVSLTAFVAFCFLKVASADEQFQQSTVIQEAIVIRSHSNNDLTNADGVTNRDRVHDSASALLLNVVPYPQPTGEVKPQHELTVPPSKDYPDVGVKTTVETQHPLN